MRKDKYLILKVFVISSILFLTAAGMWAKKPSFKFPPKIEYNLSKNGTVIGNCTYTYEKDERTKSYLLQLTCSVPMDFINANMLHTSISGDKLSVFYSSQTKGSEVISKIEIKETSDFDGKKSYSLVYTGKDGVERKGSNVSPDHSVINLLSSFLVASKRVASGKTRKTQKFQFVESNAVKIVQLKYDGKDSVSVGGTGISIPVEVLKLTSENKEMWRLNINPVDEEYCYPVSISLKDGQNLYEMITKKIHKPQTRKLQNLFVSILTFMNAATRSISTETEEVKLINSAFLEEMRNKMNELGTAKNQRFVFDAPEHRIPDKNKKIGPLMDRIFELASSPKDKTNKIISELMTPHKVDVIIAGQYVNNPGNPYMSIRPILISKSANKFVTRSLLLEKNKLICPDPNKKNKKMLCKDAQGYLSPKIREFLSLLWPTNVPVTKGAAPNSSQVKKTHPAAAKGKTIEDVYRMIIKNKFYCNSLNDNYHRTVLEKLRQSESIDQLDSVNVEPKQYTNGKQYNSYTFACNWTLEAFSEDKIVQTDSSKQKASSGAVTLFWAPQDMKMVTYKNALKKVNKLNNKKYGGFSDWRIPTLEDIFCVVDDRFVSGNFFPFNYGELFYKTIKIWTSNLADENEKNRLRNCDEEAYFTINNIHKGNHDALGFDITCSREKAYLLPVRSGKKSSPTKVVTSTTSSRPSKPPRKTPTPSGQPPEKLHIARLPYLDATESQILDTEETKSINDTVVKMIKNWGQRTNKKIEISTTFPGMEIKESVQKIIKIRFDDYLPWKNRIKKINKTVIFPDYVDVIVTGQYIDDPQGNTVTIHPIVIFKAGEKLLTQNIILDKSDLNCRDPLTNKKIICKDAADKIIRELEAKWKIL